MKQRGAYLIQALVLTAVVVAANLAGGTRFERFDLTADERYTLAAPTLRVMDSLDAILTVNLYLEGDFQPRIKRYSDAVRTTLLEMKAHAGSKIQFQYHDPTDNRDLQQELVRKGVRPVPIDYKAEDGSTARKWIFPAAVMSYRGGEEVVNLLGGSCVFAGQGVQCDFTRAEEQIEYQLSVSMERLLRRKKRMIGILSGQGETRPEAMQELIAELQRSYNVLEVNLRGNGGQAIPSSKEFLPDSIKKDIEGDGIDVLIVPQPDSAFTEREKYEIDQFVMRGGRVLWVLDNQRVNQEDFYGATGATLSQTRDLNLDDLFMRYGFRLRPDLVQDDLAGGLPVTATFDGREMIVPRKWVFFPMAVTLADHPVARNLRGCLYRYASCLDTVSVPDVAHRPIIFSSPYSRPVAAPAVIHLEKLIAQPPPRQVYKGKGNLILGMEMEGRFRSLFIGREAPTDRYAPKPPTARFLSSCSFPSRMIVLSDGALVLPHHAPQFGGPDMPYDNKALILNSIEYLMGNEALSEMRMKQATIHALDARKVQGNEWWLRALNVAAPVLLFALFGLVRAWLRRRRNLNRRRP